MTLYRIWTACAVLALAGCTSLSAPPYSPDYEALQTLRASKTGKVASVEVQPRDPKAAVNRITLRGASLSSPSGTFAQYLEEALVRDLREINVIDKTSNTRMDVVVLKNDIDISGFFVGTGQMDIQITIARGGMTRLKKAYAVTTTFESSFAVIVAVPKGQSEYSNLVRALLGKVYSDAEFIAALKE